MAVAHFYKGAELEAIKEFREPKDPTLYYRTVINAREHAEELGYDGFDMDGDAYSLKDGKMMRVVCDTEPVNISSEDETEFTRFITAKYMGESKAFADAIDSIQEQQTDFVK